MPFLSIEYPHFYPSSTKMPTSYNTIIWISQLLYLRWHHCPPAAFTKKEKKKKTNAQ